MREGMRMFRYARRFLLIALVTAIYVAPEPAPANPVGDFFKRLGNSMTKPQRRPARRKTSKAKENETATVHAVTSPTPSSLPRAATQAPASRRDLPYGVPIPGRPGFVTSPYSPDQGMVDVRGFGKGTEVKDPYSGKHFLIP